MAGEECEYGRANRAWIERAEIAVHDLRDEMTKKFDDMWEKIDELTTALNNRPSWLVVIILTAESSLVVGLITFIVCNAHKLRIP